MSVSTDARLPFEAKPELKRLMTFARLFLLSCHRFCFVKYCD